MQYCNPLCDFTNYLSELSTQSPLIKIFYYTNVEGVFQRNLHYSIL